MNQNLTIPVTSLFLTFSDVLLAENPLAIIKKITGGIRLSRTRVEINDKLAKVIFKLSDEATDELINVDTFCIVEKRGKKFGEITTAYKILNAAGYQILRLFCLLRRIRALLPGLGKISRCNCRLEKLFCLRRATF